MFTNYLKITIRFFRRNFTGSFINVFGLASGFLAFLVLWPYANRELSTDRFHKDYDRIVRICFHADWTDDKANWHGADYGTFDPALAQKLASTYAEIEDLVRIYQQPEFDHPFVSEHGKELYFASIAPGGDYRSLKETKTVYADPNLFQFFGFPLLQGQPSNVLTQSDAVVLSKRSATRYFGNSDPMGQTLLLNGKIPLTVTGVFEDLPSNTHFDFEIVLSIVRLGNSISEIKSSWHGAHTYSKLTQGTDISGLQNKLNTTSAMDIDKTIWNGWQYGKSYVFLQRSTDIAFSAFISDHYTVKSRFLLRALFYASLVIMALAWINYINLAISSNHKRVKEIGVRLSLGSGFANIFVQFFIESLTANVLALLLAITLVQVLRSPLESLLQFQVVPWTSQPLPVLAEGVSVILAGILISGIVPILITLKRTSDGVRFKETKSNTNWTWSLTSAQFAIAIVLISGSILVYRQLTYILEIDTGFKSDNRIVLNLPIRDTLDLEERSRDLAFSLVQVEGVSGATVCNSVPGEEFQYEYGFMASPGQPFVGIRSNGGVDENFLPFFGIKLIAGRNFREDAPGDDSAVIISVAAMKRLGIGSPDAAIGRSFLGTPNDLYKFNRVEIIGVMDDYKARPLVAQGDVSYGGDAGLAITYRNHLARNHPSRKLVIAVNRYSFGSLIETIENEFRSRFPEGLFTWYFLSDYMNSRYDNFITGRNQIAFFTAIGILLACLGLLGVMANKVVERTKELGVRKVFGAGWLQLTRLLLGPLFWQVIAAGAIAIPVAFYMATRYLEQFTEKISLHWWYFAIPIPLLVTILIAVISRILFKAFAVNPVETLRYE